LLYRFYRITPPLSRHYFFYRVNGNRADNVLVQRDLDFHAVCEKHHEQRKLQVCPQLKRPKSQFPTEAKQ